MGILRYRPGQEYKPHHDYLPEDDADYSEVKRSGQRARTLLMPLNEGFKGGQTVFPRLGLSFSCAAGDGLVFHNTDDNGQPYPGFFDRPHEINLVTSYDISLRIQLGLNWIYYTGAPFSSPTGFYYHDQQEIPIYSEKNNDRYPDYHRLDISANFQLNKSDKKFKHSIGVSFYNLYGNKNPVFINFNKSLTANNEMKIPGNLFTAERISYKTYYFDFLPSLVYKFKFQ